MFDKIKNRVVKSYNTTKMAIYIFTDNKPLLKMYFNALRCSMKNDESD